MFPLDVEYVFTDTITSLRPNFKFASSYAQACDMVNEMEKEVRESLNKSMPTGANAETNEGGLEAIREDEDEAVHEQYDEESEDENTLSAGEDNESSADESEQNALNDEDDNNVVLQTRHQNITSKEDDEFMKAFESMMSENISVSFFFFFFY